MIKKWLLSHDSMYTLVIRILNLFGHNSRMRGAHPSVWLKRTKVIDKGNGNTVTIDRKSKLRNCTFKFYGSNNRVIIGERCSLSHLTVWIEDDNNCVQIAKNTTVHGTTGLACIEGCRIEIGEDCMFSSNIHFRTGDSHSVVDLDGHRINPSRDIVIGDHVWIGHNAIVCKGVTVADHSIVGAGSVVTRRFEQDHVAIGGNPAKIIKENVDWKRERI